MKSLPDALAIAKALKSKKKKKLAKGGDIKPADESKDTSADTDTDTSTGGSSPGGASTGGVGSGIGGAGTGGAATGGASTGGAGTVNVTISGNSGTGSNSKGSKDPKKPTTINISNVGGRTDAGSVASGDGPGSPGTGGKGEGSGGGGGGAAPSEPKALNSSKTQSYAEGGEVMSSAKYQKRPMPNNRYNDSKEVSHNSGNKPPGEDSWTDDPTVRQAQKPSITRLSRPKMVGSDAFSVRDRDDVDKDLDRINSEYPESDKAQPRKRYDEEGANRQGPAVSDMAAQHNNKKAPYTKASEHEYAEDMANANMKKTESPLGRYAKGGVVDIIPDSGYGKIIVMKSKGGPVMEPKDHGQELEERTDEAHMMEELSSTEHGEQPAKWRDELDASKQNSNPLDMERQHNNGRKPYAEGGSVEEERDEERHASIAAAIMAKRKPGPQDSDSDEDRMVMAADGGILSHDSIYSDRSSQADLSRNADEDANEEDQLSFNALRKENYSESEGLDLLDSPEDSNRKGDEREDSRSDKNDMVSAIRSKMKSKRRA